MGDIDETFKELHEAKCIRNKIRNNFYSKIIEELGGKYLNNATYRLGEYNVYTSKGWVLPKSNRGKSIPIQVFLKEHYNFHVNGEELNKKMKQASSFVED